MQKQLLITFDYELFLGSRSGSAHDCMLVPTQKLLKVLEKHRIHAVFFVDTTYLLRLKEQANHSTACKEDFNKISEQLCELLEMGHFVYPHIHPHWLDAVYFEDGNYWKLDNVSHYRFHNIAEQERIHVFNGSFDLLKSIIHPKFPNYQVDAFRAGGWCIQPFIDFAPYFKANGVKYDFSVLGNFYQFTDAQYFDFSVFPQKNIYRFETDVCVEDVTGKLIEFNISSIEIPHLLSIANKLWLKLQFRLLNDHTFQLGAGQASNEILGLKPVSVNGKNLSNTAWERVSIELLTIMKLNNYLQFIESNRYMHFISHPKMITRHSLKVFDKFLITVFDKYSVETDFHMMNPQ
jgi:hypothetical protein